MSTATLAGRARWAAADAYVITRRDVQHWVNQPAPFVVGLLFPVLMVLMFGYLFGGAMESPAGGSYREFLLPGLFALTMAFGLEVTMIAVATDAARGVTDRFRSIPMHPAAVVVGRSAADMISAALGLAVMLACGLLVGWEPHRGMPRALAAVGLLLLLRWSLVWVGVWLGLLVKGPESVVAVQILVWPVGFLSSALVDPSTMPGWLGAVAEWNPLSATAAATRELFGNPGFGGTSFAAEHALEIALAWPLLLVAVFLPLSVLRFRKLSS
ncbi:ABC transporter permease [Motilibacter aurantiacus]|uniref:ABC transporter permease n=1 Tax=Motilibacter aurantiacus TaxID=2714955 RepID=UPI001407C0B2|nr:ABC transporter permease [Motilibacter aurantiacus]NHC46166.1 ABC transporter permease [Motilibacter aurantiacus]